MLLLVLLCAGYSVCIILGISFTVSMINHLYSFKGHCLLFSTGKYEDKGDFTPNWATPSYCFLALLVAVLSVSIAGIQLVKTSVMLYKGKRETFAITFKMTFSALTMVFLIFISGITVSVGYAIWCGTVLERFTRGCDVASTQMSIANNTQDIKVQGFFIDLETIQFSVWSSLVIWVFILTISGRMLFVAHELANIRISMARERRRYNYPADHANQPSNLPYRDIT